MQTENSSEIGVLDNDSVDCFWENDYGNCFLDYNSTKMSFGNITDKANKTDNGFPYYYPYDYMDIFRGIPEFNIWRNFQEFLKYGLLILVVTSFLGNSMVLLVVLQKKNRKFSTSTYIASLALADLLVSVGFDLNLWLQIKGYIRESHSILDCFLRGIVADAAMYASAWSLSAVAIERAISVLYPHKVRFICTPWSAKVTVTVLWGVAVAIAVYSSSISYYYETTINGEVYSRCLIQPEFMEFQKKYFYAFYYCVLFFGPFLIMLLSTIIITWALVARRVNKTSGKNIEWSVTVTLLQVNILFIILVGPNCVYNLLVSLNLFEIFSAPQTTSFTVKDVRGVVIRNLLNDISLFLVDSNSVVNVFVYFLNSSKFRKDLKKLFTFKKAVTRDKQSIRTLSTRQSDKMYRPAVVQS